MMPRPLIRVYGDSVSLPREADDGGFLETYPELIAKVLSPSGASLYNRSLSEGTATRLLDVCRSDAFYFGPDAGGIAIMQCGLFDCAPRPGSFFQSYRTRLFQQSASREFAVSVESMLELLSTTADRVYAINIAPVSSHTEAGSPGLTPRIARYNEIIAHAVSAAPSNASLIDIHSILSSDSSTDNFVGSSDGSYIRPAAHRLYAKLILDRERQNDIR